MISRATEEMRSVAQLNHGEKQVGSHLLVGMAVLACATSAGAAAQQTNKNGFEET